MNIPLVSEYKVSFILHRVVQTFFGGFEPCELIATQLNAIRLVIYLVPSLLGVLATVLLDAHLVDPYIGVLTVCIVNFFFTLSMHLISYIQQERHENEQLRVGENHKKKSSPLQWVSFVGPKCKTNTSKLSVTVCCFMAASLIGLMVNNFQLNLIQVNFMDNHNISLCLYILVWFTFANAHYSLIMGPPPETSAYSMAFNKMDTFNRPVHLLMLLSLQIFIPIRFGPYQLFTLLIATLPFLWLLGIVPPVLAMVHFLLEQTNQLLLGGTSHCSLISAATTVLFTGSILFSIQHYLDGRYFLLVCSLVAFMLSNKCFFRGNNHIKTSLCITLWHTLALLGSITSIHFLPLKTIQATETSLFVCMFCLFFLINLIKYWQRVYLLGLFKNPLGLFCGKQRLKRWQSNLYATAIIRVVLHIVLPLVCVILLRNRLSPRNTSSVTVSSLERMWQMSIHNVLAFRLLRFTWQRPLSLALQLIVIFLLDNLYPNYPTNDWPTEWKHFVLSILFSIASNFVEKLLLILTILWGSVFLKKQRLAFSGMLFVFNIVTLPVTIMVVLISCVLNAPILPLFTLPIYLISFPRPLKFWFTTPTYSNHNPDACYYEQILPRLVQALHQQRLVWDFSTAGEFLLARYDDRLMWIQVLESGYNYVQIQMKGLELQETSCHTIEANTIDQITDMAFDDEHQTYRDCFNSYFFYTISPLTRVSVTSYSEAKNLLTGIIDSPETYFRIKSLFGQVLIWVVVKKCILFHNKNPSNMSTLTGSQRKGFLHRSTKINAVDSLDEQTKYTFAKVNFDSLQPSAQWISSSYQYAKMRNIQQQSSGASLLLYTLEWFQLVMRMHTTSEKGTNNQLNETELQSLNVTYRNIVQVCHSIIFPVSYTELSTSQSICQCFNGEFTKQDLEQNFFNTNPDLYESCLQSYRYSTKIAFDQIIFSNEPVADDDLVNILYDFDHNWHFGNRNTPQWQEAVINEKCHLFSIGKDIVKENYTSNLLNLQNIDINVCSLNRSIIEAIWSSLSLELFYLTNDDEERYSIQAHPLILRNLTVQAADTPLGYPVFASKPTTINHLAYS